MKGCSLRCAWCHNPEGLSSSPQLQYFAEKCIGCAACGDRNRLSDAKKCPADALKICGIEMEEEEVLHEVLQDRIFYADNGGITFSGGECLLQADFVSRVLAHAKKEKLHTAIDTAGCVPWSAFEKTMPFCDLYLYDVKCMNPSVHKKYTGVDNALILRNLQQLSAQNKTIWIRIPVIPGFNDRADEMNHIAEFIAALPAVQQVTLMPYHTLGASKYETLGIPYPFDPGKKISEEDMASFGKIFLQHHLNLIQ